MDKLSIYVPKDKMTLKPIERIQKLAQKRDRSVNYMVVQAIIDYVEREEKKTSKSNGRKTAKKK